MRTTENFDDLFKRPGIYKIEHAGKTYIGSAGNMWKRLREHTGRLKKGTHPNRILQNAWNKHGADAFVFGVVEHVPDPSALIEREQFWMDGFALVGGMLNILPLARSALGVKRSPETIAKLSAANKGRKLSPETIAKRTASRDYKAVSDTTRLKRSESLKGRPVSAETRAKIAASLRRRAAALREATA